MPLVTRQSNQGNLFKEADTPNWANNDLWVDTDNATLYVNNLGTATAVGSSTVTSQRITLGANWTTTSSIFSDVTGMAFTADNNTGSSLALFRVVNDPTAGNVGYFQILDNATAIGDVPNDSGLRFPITLPIFVANDGQAVKLQAKNGNNISTLTIYSGALVRSGIEVFEIV